MQRKGNKLRQPKLDTKKLYYETREKLRKEIRDLEMKEKRYNDKNKLLTEELKAMDYHKKIIDMTEEQIKLLLTIDLTESITIDIFNILKNMFPYISIGQTSTNEILYTCHNKAQDITLDKIMNILSVDNINIRVALKEKHKYLFAKFANHLIREASYIYITYKNFNNKIGHGKIRDLFKESFNDNTEINLSLRFFILFDFEFFFGPDVKNIYNAIKNSIHKYKKYKSSFWNEGLFTDHMLDIVKSPFDSFTL